MAGPGGTDLPSPRPVIVCCPARPTAGFTALQASIDQARAASAHDVPVKAQLCAVLGVEHAALANEGFVTYTPESHVLLAALDALSDDAPKTPGNHPARATPWNFISNRRETVETLTSIGALAAPPAATPAYGYLGFFAATPAG